VKIDTAAVKAAIETVPALATKTFVSAAKRTNGALPVPPYLVIHPSDGIDGQTGRVLENKSEGKVDHD